MEFRRRPKALHDLYQFYTLYSIFPVSRCSKLWALTQNKDCKIETVTSYGTNRQRISLSPPNFVKICSIGRLYEFVSNLQ